MQRDREIRDNSNTGGSPFDDLGGFGFPGSMFPSLFGGKDPFSDPFFTTRHSSLFGSDVFSSSNPGNLQHTTRSKGPVIEELDSDAEEVPDAMEEDKGTDATWGNRNPIVEHPEDQSHDQGKSTSNRRDITYSTNHDKVEATKPQTRSVSFQRVTYGGIDGTYYTATTSRRKDNDGVTLEERKQADRTTGQATHRISRGIHDKGHSVTRKLDSDGKVDTVQTLHNLEQDELEGFEHAWRGNGNRHLHGWGDTFDFPGTAGGGSTRQGRLGFLDPFGEHSVRNETRGVDNLRAQSSGGRPKKVVRINIE